MYFNKCCLPIEFGKSAFVSQIKRFFWTKQFKVIRQWHDDLCHPHPTLSPQGRGIRGPSRWHRETLDTKTNRLTPPPPCQSTVNLIQFMNVRSLICKISGFSVLLLCKLSLDYCKLVWITSDHTGTSYHPLFLRSRNTQQEVPDGNFYEETHRS